MLSSKTPVPSGLLQRFLRIEAFEFYPGIRGGTPPINDGLVAMATRFPGRDLAGHRGFIGNTSVHTLACQDCQLAFGPSQPPALYGRQMTLACAPHAARFGRGEDLIERRRRRRIEMVQDDAAPLCRRKVDIHHCGHAVGKLPLGAAWGRAERPSPLARFHPDQEMTGPMPGVCVVHTRRVPRHHRQRCMPITQQLTRAFIKADTGPLGIIGLLVQLEPVCHPGAALSARALGRHHGSFNHGLRVVF